VRPDLPLRVPSRCTTLNFLLLRDSSTRAGDYAVRGSLVLEEHAILLSIIGLLDD
jgi:hypothetical protein